MFYSAKIRQLCLIRIRAYFCKKGDPLRGCSECMLVLIRLLNTPLATPNPRTEANERAKNFSQATYMTNKLPQKNKLVELRDQSSHEILNSLSHFPSIFLGASKWLITSHVQTKERQQCLLPFETHHFFKSFHQTSITVHLFNL